MTETETPRERIERIIRTFEGMEAETRNALSKITIEDPEFDVLYQLKKDLRKYIHEQLHLLSLINEGTI